MDTSAQSQANQVPRTPSPSPKLRCLTHQPSPSLEPLDRHLRGLVVQHANGVEDRIESDREAEPTGEIVHDKSSNQKTFLDKKAGVFDDTTEDGDECAITEDDHTSGREDCAIGQRVHSTSSLTQKLLGSNDAQPMAIIDPKKIRKAIVARELEGLRKAIYWEKKEKRTTADAVLKREHTGIVSALQIHPWEDWEDWDDSNWRGW